jgi:hypothetical protein
MLKLTLKPVGNYKGVPWTALPLIVTYLHVHVHDFPQCCMADLSATTRTGTSLGRDGGLDWA